MKQAWVSAITSLALMAGCSSSPPPGRAITLATTTSTRDSGLLDVLIPVFEERTGIEVKVVAVGSGQALEMGRRGDADVLLTHAPAAEERFVAEGHGIERRSVMANDFVVVGPESDPAGIRDQPSAAEAFRRIALRKALFVSRGDESGTHMKERAIWKQAGIEPDGEWYLPVGRGMAEALRVASETQAYALADRGTFLAQRDGLSLSVLLEGDPLLHNPYSVMLVNPDKHSHVNVAAARRFAEFLVAEETQKLISRFGRDRFGQPLFFPTADEAFAKEPSSATRRSEPEP
ncbi:MAG TPA: tungsten ABC transporter substrate-binding protein [Planctomycetaceae bacterium]|nr:tungsten ABC transporter substrate-binding protein [Planctomycetaceae bacterium]